MKTFVSDYFRLCKVNVKEQCKKCWGIRYVTDCKLRQKCENKFSIGEYTPSVQTEIIKAVSVLRPFYGFFTRYPSPRL